MTDTDAVLAAISGLHAEMGRGFERVYDEIGSVCDRVKPLEEDLIRREAINCAERDNEKRGVDWGKVKTGAAIAASGAVTLAAIKLLLVNWHTLIP